MNPLVVRCLKIVAWASAITLRIAGFLFGSFVWLLSGMFDSLCGNTLLAETPSPEGNLRAVVFERNCGATTSFSTQVSVDAALRAASTGRELSELGVSRAERGPTPRSSGHRSLRSRLAPAWGFQAGKPSFQPARGCCSTRAPLSSRAAPCRTREETSSSLPLATAKPIGPRRGTGRPDHLA